MLIRTSKGFINVDNVAEVTVSHEGEVHFYNSMGHEMCRFEGEEAKRIEAHLNNVCEDDVRVPKS